MASCVSSRLLELDFDEAPGYADREAVEIRFLKTVAGCTVRGLKRSEECQCFKYYWTISKKLDGSSNQSWWRTYPRMRAKEKIYLGRPRIPWSDRLLDTTNVNNITAITLEVDDDLVFISFLYTLTVRTIHICWLRLMIFNSSVLDKESGIYLLTRYKCIISACFF